MVGGFGDFMMVEGVKNNDLELINRVPFKHNYGLHFPASSKLTVAKASVSLLVCAVLVIL